MHIGMHLQKLHVQPYGPLAGLVQLGLVARDGHGEQRVHMVHAPAALRAEVEVLAGLARVPATIRDMHASNRPATRNARTARRR